MIIAGQALSFYDWTLFCWRSSHAVLLYRSPYARHASISIRDHPPTPTIEPTTIPAPWIKAWCAVMTGRKILIGKEQSPHAHFHNRGYTLQSNVYWAGVESKNWHNSQAVIRYISWCPRLYHRKRCISMIYLITALHYTSIVNQHLAFRTYSNEMTN